MTKTIVMELGLRLFARVDGRVLADGMERF